MRLTIFTLFLCLLACTSPEGQLSDLKQDFLQEYESVLPLTFTIDLPHSKVVLPLPPDDAALQKMTVFCQKYAQKAAEIDSSRLKPEQQTGLTTFKTQIRDLYENAQNALNGHANAASYALNEQLDTLSKTITQPPTAEAAHALLQKIPAYYGIVLKNWRKPNPATIPTAIQQSIVALKILDQWAIQFKPPPNNAPKDMSAAITAAQYAIKDFMAMCQSSVIRS